VQGRTQVVLTSSTYEHGLFMFTVIRFFSGQEVDFQFEVVEYQLVLEGVSAQET